MPVSGYYEWLTLPDGKKQPFYFTRTNGRVMSIAAVHDRWVDSGTRLPVQRAMVMDKRMRLWRAFMIGCRCF